MSSCLVCRRAGRIGLLDLGCQPVSSHYATASAAAGVRHPLELAVCPHCGVVQLGRPFPFQDLTPKFDWITYREPEDHLDSVVARIGQLPGVGAASVIGGLTYKDRTTLDRLQRAGHDRTWIVDPWRDLDAADGNANIETIHGLLTPDRAAAIVDRNGSADVLIVRHLAEHAGDPWQFIESLATLLSPGGYIVLEVPDCARNLELIDYTMLWEEHSLYLTRETLPSLLAGHAMTTLGVEVHPYPFEDCLVLYARRDEPVSGSAASQPAIDRSVAQGEAYATAFDEWTGRYQGILDSLAGEGALALYGAGHLTCAFVNFHGLAGRFSFVVDDTPQKQGLYLPGSGLPIVSKERLANSGVKTCLLGLAPELEERVIAANARYTAGGGRFASILAASRLSLRRT